MTQAEPIRVAIADDQVIVRSGLAAILMAFQDMELVGEANDGNEAIELCELVQPDVILMDLKMPEMDGIQATRLIRERWPHIEVLVLTSFTDKETIENALKAGATGYLLKDVTATELAQAIREVHSGRRMVAKAASETLKLSEHLDALSEALKEKTLAPRQLTSVLNQHLPNIFPNSEIIITLHPEGQVFVHPSQIAHTIQPAVWNWIEVAEEAEVFLPGDRYPWGGSHPDGTGMILVPIKERYGPGILGGISIVRERNLDDLDELLPVAQSVASRIASTVQRKINMEDAQAKQHVANELATAGKIQASILPEEPPEIPGWEISAKLVPARETSGDFYDFISLANGNWGLLIADVTDKGIGSALFMALSSTLIRTYATQYPTMPALTMGAVNQRILSDTRGSLFVTSFFGVLEPNTGRLRYVNAGHNPPYLISGQKGKPVDRLSKTGMALGVLDSANWQQKIAKFAPGDMLVLYTDGITEAQNSYGDFYGEQRLLSVIRSKKGCAAQNVRDTLVDDVRQFLGEAKHPDDIAVMVVVRK